MKTIKRRISLLFHLVLVVSTLLTISAFAAEGEQDGLVAALTFDKQEYAEKEAVYVTLTVKNNNAYAVEGIQTEIILPDGITLKEGSLTQEAFSLDSAESRTGETIQLAKAAGSRTDTSFPTGLVVVLVILVGGVLLVIGRKQKKFHPKGVMSILLCMAMVGAMLPMAANAEGEKASFSVEETVKIDGEDVTVKATVSYPIVQYSDGSDGTASGAEDGTGTIAANEVPEAEVLADQMREYYLYEAEPQGNTFAPIEVSTISLPETQEQGKGKLLALPLYRQSHNFTCGVACVASILRYAGYDFDTREDRLLWELAATPENGTNYRNITAYLDSVRMEGFPDAPVFATEVVCADYTMDEEDLALTDGLLLQFREALDGGSPVICVIQAWKDDGDYQTKTEDDGHYVVLIGYQKDAQTDTYLYYFMDPSTSGSYTYLTEEELILRWHDSLEGNPKRIAIPVAYQNARQGEPIDIVYHLG